MQNGVKMSLKGKISGNGQMNRLLMILKKKLTPGFSLTLAWGYMYMDIIVKQIYLYISQVSGER